VRNTNPRLKEKYKKMKLKQFFDNNKKIILTIILALILIITIYFIYNYNKKDLKKAEYYAEELKDDEDVFKNSVTPKKSIIEPKVANPNLIENKEKKPKIFYHSDGKTVWYIQEYNENGQKTKTTWYQDDGKTVWYINEYNENEKLVKKTLYQDDGKTIKQINEYNENKKLVKTTFYNSDGTIKNIIEYHLDGTEKK
jgi:antitoxin component YwqK of YwqJK toxin-antitoxin module